MSGSSAQSASGGLLRTFGMREAVTITAGSVIGVGLFTVGSSVVGDLGSSVILATLLALAVSIYPALLYAEMGSALPYAGGTYQFASLGLGRAAGMLAGWNFIISLVAVTGGEALAFSFYFKTLLSACGLALPIGDVALAVFVTAAFTVSNLMGVKLTGRLQNGFMFFFWGVAALWFLMMIPNVSLPAFVARPSFLPTDPNVSFIGQICLVWWCYAGFLGPASPWVKRSSIRASTFRARSSWRLSWSLRSTRSFSGSSLPLRRSMPSPLWRRPKRLMPKP